MSFAGAAVCQTCPTYTYNLTNGTTADASQVMANFNTVRTCVNGLPTPTTPPPARAYIAGVTLSTAGSSTTFGISAGQATDSTNVASLALAAVYTKTTAAWAVGSAVGALDTGTIANNTWYHVFLIQRTDTGVVDVLISTSPTAPVLPTPYSLFRRIGSMKTNGSGQWLKFYQIGNQFLWDSTAIVSEVNFGTIATAPAATVVNAPMGIQVQDLFSTSIYGGSSSGAAYLYFQDAPLGGANSATAAYSVGSWVVGQTAVAAKSASWTDTSQHIYAWASQSQSGAWSWLTTYGWIDPRGTNN